MMGDEVVGNAAAERRALAGEAMATGEGGEGRGGQWEAFQLDM